MASAPATTIPYTSTSYCCSRKNMPVVYHRFFIFWKLTQWWRFVTCFP